VRARPSTIGLVTVACLQAAAGGVYAYYSLFSTFRPWDDEGTFMLWDRYLLGGAALYDDVWNIYGPVPYLLRWVLHVLGVPITHDATRFMTLVLWLATAGLLSLATYRMTRSLAAAVLAHLLVVRYVACITNEPRHSQEYLLVLLAAVVCASTFVARAPRATLGALGAAAAAAAFVKVNAGVYLALGLGTAILAVTAPRSVLTAARVLTALALLIAPLLLIGAVAAGPVDAASPWTAFAVAYTVAAALVLAASWRLRPADALPPPSVGVAIAAAFGTAAIVVGLTMALLGSSLGALLNGVFLLPSRQFSWSAPTGERLGHVGLAVTMLVVFAAMVVLRRRSSVLYATTQGVFGAAVCLLAALLPAVRPTYLLMLWAVPPFLFLTLPPRDQEEPLADVFPRLVLALTAVAQLLYVYPVTGTQVMLATFLFLPCGVVALHDGAAALLRRLAPPSAAARLRLVGSVLLVAALAVEYGVMGRRAHTEYEKGWPLGLPGAARLRLSEEPRVAIFRWLAYNAPTQCETFVALPTFNSLYFWSGVEPPGPLSRSLVLDVFDKDHQRGMMDALARFPRRCVMLSSGELAYWFPGQLENVLDLPLVQDAQNAFGTAGDLWGWLLLVPLGRMHPQLTYAACTRQAGDTTAISLAVPPLGGGSVGRFVLTDLRKGEVLADSESPEPETTLRVDAPGSLDLGSAGHVVLRTGAGIPDDGFIVVRLYDAMGTWRESVPVLGTCESQPVVGS
jgi:hypothetical protein